MIRPTRDRSGFTLVEMLVALAVAGIALAAGFAALATLQDRTEYATEANVRILEGASTRAMIVDWIAGAQWEDDDLAVQFQGLPIGSTLGSIRGTSDRRGRTTDLGRQIATSFASGATVSDELYFPTTARTPLDVPVTAVRFFLDRDPATPEVGLVAEIHGRQAELPKRVQLVSQVTAMHIRYHPDIDGEVELAPDWQGRDGLPRAVFLYLEADPSVPLPPLLAFPIRVALGTQG